MAGTAISAQAAGGRRLRREMGTVGVLFSSVGVVIGSGWLFGAFNASKIAGPAALLAWVIGGAAVAVLALNVAELGGMYAVAGGEVRFAHIAFGSMAGFALGWFQFIAGCTTAPIETEAILTYASGYVPGLVNAAGVLQPFGYLVAGIVLLVFTVINILGVRWMSEVNKYAVWWKIAIPCLAVVAIAAVSFRGSFFTGHDPGGFMPFGMKGVLSAVTGGGIVFAYSGYDSAIAFGAESKNPSRNIPVAVIGAMLIGFVIYIALDIAFLGALRGTDVTHGWANIQLSSTVAGPFAAIAGGAGLGWLALVLYIDAIISPGGTGLLGIGITSRYVFALARNRYIPAFFGTLSGRGTPIVGILLTVLVGLFVFAPFPSWGELVGFASSAGVICVAILPPALGALRRTDPDRRRPFKLPLAPVMAPLGFVVANQLILFSGFGVVWKLLLAILVGFLLLVLGVLTRAPDQRPNLDLRHSVWVAPWLIGLAVISFLASFKAPAPDPNTLPFTTISGGDGVLPFGIDMLVLAAFSLVMYYVAVSMKLSAAQTSAYVEEFSAEASEEPAPVV